MKGQPWGRGGAASAGVERAIAMFTLCQPVFVGRFEVFPKRAKIESTLHKVAREQERECGYDVCMRIRTQTSFGEREPAPLLVVRSPLVRPGSHNLAIRPVLVRELAFIACIAWFGRIYRDTRRSCMTSHK